MTCKACRNTFATVRKSVKGTNFCEKGKLS
ncbi:hypothetical protein [Paenibacillus thiaminolyticus]